MKNKNIEDNNCKWDLSDYFKSFDEWEKSFSSYAKDLDKIKEYNGKLTTQENILKCLKLLEKIDKDVQALYVYANSMHDLDVTNTKMQEMLNKIEAKLTEQSVKSSFVTPQLTNLSTEFLEDLISKQELLPYKKILCDVLREKPHVLSEDNEKLLSNSTLFSGGFDTNFSNFENGDLKFNNVKNKNGEILPMSESLASLYLRDKDPVLRENAYKELNGAFGRFNNFLTSNYINSVKKDVFYARARKFDSALQKSLFYEEVDKNVYNKLIEKVEEYLPLEHKYFYLKKKLLNLKTFKTSDVYYNPLKNSKKYSYEQAKQIVCSALDILGKDYINQLNKMFSNNKIDVFPAQNKRNGAYETVAYGHEPIVLTNFNGNFDDISTLAHELGHAMHSFYSNKVQSCFNAGYTIFLAEIASTVNETILNNYMLKNAQTKDKKLFYLNEFISRFHATVFRQTMFAEFESFSHNLVEQNLPISTQVLNENYLNLVKKYFGKNVKVLNEVKYEWCRIPHFYSAFYVYKYATGLISAINIVENLKDGTITVEDYKKFLSSGCTKDPISLLKIVKVDLQTDVPFNKAFEVLNDYLNNLNKLTK